MHYLFIALLTMEQPLWKIKNTGIYTPVFHYQTGRARIAISGRGEVFILDTRETRLIKYAAGGGPAQIIATMGEGPGELANPLQVDVFDDHVYVLEMGKRSLHVFSTDGHFVKDLPFPKAPFTVAVARVNNGWALANWEFSRDPGKAIEIALYNNRMSESAVLASWPRERSDEAHVVRVGPDRVVPYNPARTRHFFASSLDGKRLFVSIPSSGLKVNVYDTETRSLLRTITEPSWSQLPFDETWGEGQLARRREATGEAASGHGFQAPKSVADFPRLFPIVRYFFVAADGSLVVARWTGRPDKMFDTKLFDKEGLPTKSSLSPASLTRVLAIYGETAIVTTFDDEVGEAGLAALPLARVNAFSKDRPIPFRIPMTTGVMVSK